MVIELFNEKKIPPITTSNSPIVNMKTYPLTLHLIPLTPNIINPATILWTHEYKPALHTE